MSPSLRRLCLLTAILLVAVLALNPLAAQPAPSRTYLFCFWNVENFFDDKSDKGREKVDREFDDFYAKDRDAMGYKLQRMVDVLLSKEMNDGKGPDILCVAEVESKRAAELIRDALNKELRDKKLHYTQVACLDPGGLRSIATAVISRVPFNEKKTRLLGRMQRILEVHFEVGKSELIAIVSHWTARVSDTRGSGRANYASTIQRDFASRFRTNPDVDYLVCGDFNDTPGDPSVTDSLGAVGDLNKVLGLNRKDRPLFFNPFSDLAKAGKGTHYFRDTPYVFDQIVVSPGLLDGQGWSYANKSARIVEKLQYNGKPDRFGGPGDRRPWRSRGASDHYPVTIELRVR